MFSCVVFPYLRPYQSHKFSFHTEKCMFVSNSFNHKGYKCMNVSERVYIVQNIIFNEKEFSFFSDVHFKQSASILLYLQHDISTLKSAHTFKFPPPMLSTQYQYHNDLFYTFVPIVNSCSESSLLVNPFGSSQHTSENNNTSSFNLIQSSPMLSASMFT